MGFIFENSILDVTTAPGRTTSKSLRFLRTPFRQELPLKVEKRAKGKKAWDATLLRLRGPNKGLGLRVLGNLGCTGFRCPNLRLGFSSLRSTVLEHMTHDCSEGISCKVPMPHETTQPQTNTRSFEGPSQAISLHLDDLKPVSVATRVDPHVA